MNVLGSMSDIQEMLHGGYFGLRLFCQKHWRFSWIS